MTTMPSAVAMATASEIALCCGGIFVVHWLHSDPSPRPLSPLLSLSLSSPPTLLKSRRTGTCKGLQLVLYPGQLLRDTFQSSWCPLDEHGVGLLVP